MPDTNKEWIYWGETDPLWAVSSRPGRQRGGSHEWTPAEFLAEGADYYKPVLDQWSHYGMGKRHCVEIGSGSGRLTKQLLSSFEKVTAIDVSALQLDNAKRLLGADSDRVVFEVVNEPMLPVEDQSADGMFSAEVFQHFSGFAPIESYLREAFRALSSSGSVCFQLPLAGMHPVSKRRFVFRAVRSNLERALGRRRIMDYRFYEGTRVLSALETLGFKDCEVRVFNVGAHNGQHAFFFARKP